MMTYTWNQRAAACIGDAWLSQAFRHQQDRNAALARLIERLRSDFADRAHAVADVIANTASRLATPGAMTEAEYTLLHEPIHRALPFMNPEVRQDLARRLVAEHARLEGV